MDAVLEERTVREPGQRVVEGLVDELLLERLALADVARVEDEAADVRVVEQVRDRDLRAAEPPVAVPDRELEHAHAVRLAGTLPRASRAARAAARRRAGRRSRAEERVGS